MLPPMGNNAGSSSTLHPVDHPVRHLSGGASSIQGVPGHGEMAVVGELFNPDRRLLLVLPLVLLVLLLACFER